LINRGQQSVWDQIYIPVAGSLGWSAALATLPILVLFIALGILRLTAWKSGLLGLLCACLVARFVYGMPTALILSSAAYGAAFGLLPIVWIVYWAVALYRLTVDTGQFEIIKDSVGHLTRDPRLQALLIAFAFGAFLEGAAGFGTPVAVAAAMMTGLGFTPFQAATLCLIANTAPVAFGAIGTPLVTLAGVTNLPLAELSADVGRICAPVSLFIPAYLMLVMGGWPALSAALPPAAVCGICFAAVQFLVSTHLGPYLTDILASIAAIIGLLALMQVWRPAPLATNGSSAAAPGSAPAQAPAALLPTATLLRAWSPYILLVIFVLLWGFTPFKALLDKATIVFGWPGLDGHIRRLAPVVATPGSYAAKFTLNLVSASGTSAMLATLCTALFLRVPVKKFMASLCRTTRDLAFSILTITSVVGLAYVMNYSGTTATLALALAATGASFPFFSALLGWLGVFLTGSDTSANALFGNLQVVTANKLGFSPSLMAAVNSSGGVMGKMVSLQSISVAAAATGMPPEDEARLFRFTLKHSLFLAAIIGAIALFYSYVLRF
jgi:lactate permease